MNQLTACIFPDTLPDEQLLFPLVQVFDQLVQMQAVEDEPLQSRLLTPFVASLLEQNRLGLVTTAPLGGQRQRFLALVHDMHTRGDDYLSQLSLLTLAGMNQRQESKSTLISSLLHRVDILPAQQAEEQLLWQARLTLKLGELYELQQAELHQALGSILRQKEHLLAELKDDEDDIFALTGSLEGGLHDEASMMPHLLKAWTRLYFHAPPISTTLFVTGYEGALDALEEACRHRTGQAPVPLASLALPLLPGGPAPALNPADRLIERCPEPVRQALHTLEIVPDYSPAGLQKIAAALDACHPEWLRCLEACYPAARHDRCMLDLIAYPLITARQLFMEGLCGPGSLPAEPQQSGETSPGLLVGLVRTATAGDKR